MSVTASNYATMQQRFILRGKANLVQDIHRLLFPPTSSSVSSSTVQSELSDRRVSSCSIRTFSRQICRPLPLPLSTGVRGLRHMPNRHHCPPDLWQLLRAGRLGVCPGAPNGLSFSTSPPCAVALLFHTALWGSTGLTEVMHGGPQFSACLVTACLPVCVTVSP